MAASLRGKDIISIQEMEKKEIELVLDSAGKMDALLSSEDGRRKLKQMNSANVVSLLFFEPSTRTKMSFATSAKRLGTSAITFSAATSSLKKGESFSDTIRMFDGYSDLIVVRSPFDGAARLAAETAKAPIINAGDGANHHPTQTLLDLYTIKKAKGRTSGLNFCLFGDLKYARTMHSLLYALGLFGNSIELVSPKGLEMPESLVKEARELGAEVRVSAKPDLEGTDFLYACRIQKERFSDAMEAEAVASKFRITREMLSEAGAKPELKIMHPLPKIDEIEAAIDKTENALYFEQAANGVPTRMALINEIL